jgi:hypothetical protein
MPQFAPFVGLVMVILPGTTVNLSTETAVLARLYSLYKSFAIVED